MLDVQQIVQGNCTCKARAWCKGAAEQALLLLLLIHRDSPRHLFLVHALLHLQIQEVCTSILVPRDSISAHLTMQVASACVNAGQLIRTGAARIRTRACALSLGLRKGVHTVRDSSLIMCRTRRTMFPTASSACDTPLAGCTASTEVVMRGYRGKETAIDANRVHYPVASLLVAECPTS